MSSGRRSHPPRTSSARSSNRFTRTEIIINVYDLLPPSKLSSCLWPLGLSLLHTGIVLDDREYSYGAVPAPTPSSSSSSTAPAPQTGVFWTRPRLEPPGGTFRCSLLQGITYLSRGEIAALVRDVAARFPGTAYDLLHNNCNHFTNHMCRALTQREAPAWINRASRVGTLLPCLVPAAWLEPPEADDGDIPEVDEDEEGVNDDERSPMMPGMKRPERPSMDARPSVDSRQSMDSRRSRGSRRGSVQIKDSAGRALPISEQAPTDRLV